MGAHQADRSGKFLSLFPSFTEGMVHKIIDGSKKEVKDELQMYVTEARFMLSRPAASVDLKTFADAAVHPEHRSGDQARGHQAVRRLDARRTRRATEQQEPGPRLVRRHRASPTCIRSTYKLEGKLPIGVALANKLRDSERKLSDTDRVRERDAAA